MVNAWNAKWAGTGIDCIPNCTHISSQIDTQSSIEHDYLPSFLLGNQVFFPRMGLAMNIIMINQLTALYLKMLAPKGRLSLCSKDDCIVCLWLRCDGCDFTLNKQDSQHILSKVSKLVTG